MSKKDIIPTIDLQNSREYYGAYNSRDFYKGRSFNFAEEWSLGVHYFNDGYITDFVSFNGALLVCRKSHISTEENRPILLYQDEADSKRPTGIDSSPYWDFVLSGTSGATGDTGQVYVPEYDQSSGNITWTLSKDPIDIDPIHVKGDKGDPGKGIDSIKKTSSSENIDTYTIRYTTGETSTFTVTNGKNGLDGSDGADGKNGRGISNISGPTKNGLLDTYTIHYSDGTISKFTVTNGETGAQGIPGRDGRDGRDGQDGEDGKSATISIASTETVSSDSPASVINIGTATEAVFKFFIPKGTKGDKGDPGIGIKGDKGDQGPEGKRVKLYRDFTDDTIKWGYDGEPVSEWTVLCYMEHLRGVSIIDAEITDDAHLEFTLSSGHYTYNTDEEGNPIKDENGNIIYDKWVPDTIKTEGKAAATLTAGKIEMLKPGEEPSIDNVGTVKDPIWDFYIPRGFTGEHAIHVGPEDPVTFKNSHPDDADIQEAYKNADQMIWVDTNSDADFDHLNAVYHAYKESGGKLSFDEFKVVFSQLSSGGGDLSNYYTKDEVNSLLQDATSAIWIPL